MRRFVQRITPPRWEEPQEPPGGQTFGPPSPSGEPLVSTCPINSAIDSLIRLIGNSETERMRLKGKPRQVKISEAGRALLAQATADTTYAKRKRETDAE